MGCFSALISSFKIGYNNSNDYYIVYVYCTILYSKVIYSLCIV